MIRSLAFAVWIVCLTLSSAYVAGSLQHIPPGSDSAPSAEASVSLALQSLTVPVIANGSIQGYVLTQIAVSVKPGLVKSLPQPAEPVLADAAFQTLYAEEQIDFRHLEKQDLARLSRKILEAINARAGGPVAGDVFIQELQYLSKQDEKAGSLFRR